MTAKPTYEELERRVQELEQSESARNLGEDIVQNGQYRWLVENANELILVAQDGLIRFVNQKAFDYLGYSPEELKDGPFIQYIYPEDREKVLERHLKRMKGEDLPGVYPFRVVDRDGKVRWMEINAVLSEWNGKPATLNYINEITDRKQAEEDLLRERERLASILEGTNVGTWEWNVQTGETIFNERWAEIIGYSFKEIAPVSIDTWMKFTHPDDLKNSGELLQRHFSGELDYYECEARMRHKNGEWVWVLDRGKVAVWTEDRKPLHIMGTHQDITERKKDLIALKENRQLLQSMLEAIPDMVSVHDKDMTILYSNWNGFGSVPEEKRIIGTKCYHTYRGYNEICPDCQAKTVLQTNRNFQTEAQLPDGRWVDLRVIPILDNDGRVDMFMEWVRDITERKQADLDVRSQKRLLEGVLDSINDIIGVQLPDHTMVQYNRAGYELLGLTEDQVRGKKCYELLGNPVPCDHCATSRTYISKRMETVEKFIPELERHFLCNSNPVLDDNGNIKLIIEQLTDITEKKKIDEKLQQAQKMESIGTLAGGIAHDFNNILFPIIGHTEILLDDLPDEGPVRESLKEIHTGGLRARDLVQQILAFSRQEKNELTIMKMQPIIKEVIKLIRATIPTTISIRQNIQSDCGPIQADPTQIHQIIMNLATNAWHAMEENGGELTISLKKIIWEESDLIPPDMSPGLYACLSVADTGMGMNKDIINKIFDPFFTTKETGKGTGMGLSVVHGIVKSMNGTIQVYSEPGKGTEFKIYLPIVGSVFENQKTDMNPPVPGGIERIFLVDDEAAIIALEKASLSRLGYQVTTCINSTEALKIFQSNPDQFDLVITDMAMPKMSGDKLAVELIKIRPDIPILLCTGFSENMTDEKIQSLGIKGLLMKPIVIRDLAQKVREVLDK